MLIPALIVIVSLIVLVWSADKFVYGAAGLARNLGISPLVIGLTVVAFGSSAPEMLVAASASLNGNPDTAVGNALGSNITNIAMVLGITALVRPLKVSSATLKREFPLLLLITFGVSAMFLDLNLSIIDGCLLVAGLIAFTGLMMRISMQEAKAGDPLITEAEAEIPSDLPTAKAVLWLAIGLLLLLGSSELLVTNAVELAHYFGVSDLVIGLTIIAIGTSLPELAASVAGALRNEGDLALGNIIGSNIFNLFAVLAMPALLAPGKIDEQALYRDIPIMIGVTVLLFIFCYGWRGKRILAKWEGGLLAACFIGYQILLFSNLR
ncbi:calcium/sodium antiporter [Corallincola spongiicola]|uniref:Calcium/sodium antiporter n=1 Tax=Corallincola spongiicola TaxID=2520508 RepID=A0ABY1WNW3_9GAMM|nr:calcium/sodium antiporter [Corallincola spongiicola]TAA45167.1 calcium/sodium antiporter [Corallincola spongiicola]